MTRQTTVVAAIVGLALIVGDKASAETTVKLTDMHICCKGCANAVTKSVAGLDGVEVTVDQDAEEATITAADPAAAQKAVDAIAGAGFHATVVGEGVSMPTAEAPSGKVSKLTVGNVHNCCGSCTKAIQGAIKSVDGVKSDTCKPKLTEFTVEGNFDAQALVAALEKAGFHVTVK